ncbi:3-deoxy-7-phosphoheptulonate synthase class II [Pleionea litopenaei]|uniref:Phospho-2-dehydro-3-deoxyheptonate aldolase n=1 Tax=Pleionea litopenaei TaxID=3070815 RepID=A0AA51RSD3_9GAMM|nr:3-deoxy-7-phosphoheptulonate synthase class II [Pleionea sp. HL-JVS1]WMS86645.1 3-deoxy-7-phosphoheptulonate synthase class II [Pleionea sp. HL-JVS1]
MWTPDSWQKCPVEQQADYSDNHRLQQVTHELSSLPPLVSAHEVDRLQSYIAQAARGEVFLLQGGDCAESFEDCNPATIHRKLNVMLQMSLMLMYGLGKPVIRVGRMAGQYAKPRSAHTETVDGVSLPAYRGDLINQSDFNQQSRQPDPDRLLKGYSLASLTLNYIRAHSDQQLSDLLLPERWSANELLGATAQTWQQKMLDEALQAYTLIERLSPQALFPLTEFFTCHEALHLHYEQALSRQTNNQWYNLSTHLPWVGMRTAKPDSGHIEYLKGIENPIAIKVGPRMSVEWLLQILATINPNNIPGRVTLITRMGHRQIHQKLPPLIEALQHHQTAVTWICDPMHGNTELTRSGVKTRFFHKITEELQSAFKIHQQLGSTLGGVHLELTGDAVTECIGGTCAIAENDLSRAYHSLVDPRLNLHQSLELTLDFLKLTQEQGIKSGFQQQTSSIYR